MLLQHEFIMNVYSILVNIWMDSVLILSYELLILTHLNLIVIDEF